MHYFFHLGFAPGLARRELANVLAQKHIKYSKQSVNAHQLVISTKKPLHPQSLIDQLGGTLRIAPQITTSDQDSLQSTLSSLLAHAHTPKLNFTVWPANFSLDTHSLHTAIKSHLQSQAISARFLPSDNRLTSPQYLLAQRVFEIILVKYQHTISVYQTQAVTNSVSWADRDRGRPAVDPQSGMLPLKVARMLLNLATSYPITPQTTILDPFCGSGTILLEAAYLGASVIGFDQDPTAVSHTRTNLQWLQTQNRSFDYQILPLNSSSTSLTNSHIDPVDAIVTEGYLGPSTPPRGSQLHQLIHQLQQFYAQTLPNLRQFLRPQARIVIALPRFHSPTSVKSLQTLIDTCENSGYTHLTGPLIYGQPHAQIKRAIYVLQRI